MVGVCLIALYLDYKQIQCFAQSFLAASSTASMYGAFGIHFGSYFLGDTMVCNSLDKGRMELLVDILLDDIKSGSIWMDFFNV